MKKLSKILALGVATVTAFSMATMGLAACGDDDSDGGVTDAQWQAVLNFSAEKYNNYTIVQKYYNTYDKNQVEEYGEWESTTRTIKIDLKGELYSEIEQHESYDADQAQFETRTDTKYCFKYGQAYYDWTKWHGNESASISSMTKASLIERLERYEDITAIFQAYSQPSMRAMFKYNSSTGMYDMSQMGVTVSLQFLDDNGVRLVNKQNSIQASEIIVKDINKTTVTVPNNVKTDVDAYIAEQNSENA